MKYILLSITLALVSCGKSNVIVTLANKGNSGNHYQQPNELTVDIQTITDEVEIVSTNPQSSFIKDFSKVNVLPSSSSNHYSQVGNTLYRVNLIDKLNVKMEGNKVVQDLSAKINYELSYTAFQMQAIDLTTNKVIYTKIFDDHFNENSFLPTKNGEYWYVRNIDFNSQRPTFLYQKMTLGSNCPGTKTFCSKMTDEYAIASLDVNAGNIKFVTAIKGAVSRAYYYNSSIYYYQIVNNNLVINRLNTQNQVTTKQMVALHSNQRDQLNKFYFLKDSFYVSGSWSQKPSVNLLELMKFDLDLTEDPAIAFDNATSGPDGNIDVVDDGKYITTVERLSSMNDNILLVTSDFDLGNNKQYYDTYLIDSTSGELATYFNKKAPLSREYVKNEIFYNDDNHIYFLKYDKESLILDSVNKGGVPSLINKALSAKIKFKRTFTNPRVSFFEIHDGVATILIFDQNKYYLKRFNIH
jgi:hypothetical protein